MEPRQNSCRGGGSLEVIGVGSKEETSGEKLMKDKCDLFFKSFSPFVAVPFSAQDATDVLE